MKNNAVIIEKGVYKHPQPTDLICVKEYMFVLSNNKKCLAQRFINNSDFAVNSMKFTLIEYDEEKNVIQKRKFNYDSINVKPGEIYVPKRHIVLSDACVDYSIVMNRISSGPYHYMIKGNDYLLYYKTKSVKYNSTFNSVSITKTYKRSTVSTVALAILSILFMIGICGASVAINEYFYYNPIDFTGLFG